MSSTLKRKRRKPRLNGTACAFGKRCIAQYEFEINGKKRRLCPRHAADEVWRRRIMERDQWCRRCGSPSDLQAAHVHSRSYHATRWQLGNGMALCRACHLWQTEHRLEGDDFFVSVIGEENFAALRHMALTYDAEDPRDALERLSEERA